MVHTANGWHNRIRKSEVIQSIIAALAATYHPHEMAFMLIDYKGGGMSNTFAGLPHIIASITNLEDPNN